MQDFQPSKFLKYCKVCNSSDGYKNSWSSANKTPFKWMPGILGFGVAAYFTYKYTDCESKKEEQEELESYGFGEAIDACIDPNQLVEPFRDTTPLTLAMFLVIEKGDEYLECYNILLAHTNANMGPSDTGMTLLLTAIGWELKDLIPELIDISDVTISLYKKTVLHHLARLDYINDSLDYSEFTRSVLKKGADINAQTDLGYTAFHFAAINCNVPVLKVLA